MNTSSISILQVRIFLKEAKYEFLKYLRLPIYVVVTLLFPVMFYVMFCLLMNRQATLQHVGLSTYFIAVYGVFGVLGASLMANGSGVAMERGLGWMQVKRASPMPALAYFTAKFAVSFCFGGMIAVLLLAVGTVFGGVRVSLVHAGELILVLAAGAIPFSALGLVIGSFAGANSAPAMVQLIYLPLSFASGIFFPIEAMPRYMRNLAPALPPHHLAQLALHILGGGRGGSMWGHCHALVGVTLLCLGVAWIGFARDQKMYG